MHVVICGAGVIGAATAYFLSRRGIAVTVVERCGVACAASGKAGGFLARDWCDGTPVEALARHSFDLHARVAAELGGEAWGYRRMTTYAGVAGGDGRGYSGSRYRLGWLSPSVGVTQALGTPDNTAQVHPGKFTTAMMRAAEASGARLVLAEVTGLRRDGDRVTGVEIGGDVIEADAVLVAMGPWSLLACAWLPLPAVFGLKGHSLVFATGDAVPPEALFAEYREGSGEAQSPELFPRPDGTTYICAISSEAPLPLDPADVAPDEGAIERLHRICRDLSSVLAASELVAAQACFRPIARDGLPLIGRVPGIAGAYIATGHSVWGILNAPATGEAVAELIADGRANSIDLSPFDPGRLPPLDPSLLRRARAG